MELVPLAPFDGEAILPIAEAMQILRVDGNEQVAVAATRDAAIDFVERHVRHGLSRRQWQWSVAGVRDALRPGMRPIHAVTAIDVIDHNDMTTSLVAGDWSFALGTVRIKPAPFWRSAQRIVVTFDAGFSDVTKEAAGLLSAVKLLMLHLWDGGDAGDAPSTVALLCNPFRTPVLA